MGVLGERPLNKAAPAQRPLWSSLCGCVVTVSGRGLYGAWRLLWSLRSEVLKHHLKPDMSLTLLLGSLH